MKVLKWIRSHHLDRFTKRDAHRALQHVFPRADDLDAPLEMLEERLFIRRQADSHDGPGRHPSPTFVTNPRWLEVLTQMTERGFDRDCVSSVSTIRDPGPVNPETTETRRNKAQYPSERPIVRRTAPVIPESEIPSYDAPPPTEDMFCDGQDEYLEDGGVA